MGEPLTHILQRIEIESKGMRVKADVRSIHCVRIGYEYFPDEETPVVILVVVRPGVTAAAAAVVVMKIIKDLCVSPRYVSLKVRFHIAFTLLSPHLRSRILLSRRYFDVRVATTF